MEKIIEDKMWEQCENEGNQLQPMKEISEQNSCEIKPSIISETIPKISHISVMGSNTNLDSYFMGKSKV